MAAKSNKIYVIIRDLDSEYLCMSAYHGYAFYVDTDDSPELVDECVLDNIDIVKETLGVESPYNAHLYTKELNYPTDYKVVYLGTFDDKNKFDRAVARACISTTIE